MRRRDVLVIDVIICFAMFAAVLLLRADHGAYAFILLPVTILARIILQRSVHDKDKDQHQRTFRRTFFNMDPISFELFYWSVLAVTAVSLLDMSAYLSAAVISFTALLRLFLEFFWFSDRPNRWYSFRFRLYNMRRRFRPSYSERLQKILVTEVDKLKGHAFERYVAELLGMNGFRKVKVTRGSGDFGVDVTAMLDKDRYAIQCKRSEAKIGIKAVQEAFLGKEHYKADVAVVITNNFFTKQAHEAAEGKVALWDRERLGNLIRKARNSLSDEKYNEQMAASETEIRMFVALFDKGRGDARLTEKVMGTIYPAGNIRSEEDMAHFLRRVTEHIYDRDGMPERRLMRLRKAIEKDRSITPYEADMAFYHLSDAHLIMIKDMGEMRSKLAKAFIETD